MLPAASMAISTGEPRPVLLPAIVATGAWFPLAPVG